MFAQDYIALSGGLGSSAYVKARIKVRFEAERGQRRPQIISSEEP